MRSPMKMKSILVLALCAAALAAPPAAAQRRGDQVEVFDAMRGGRVLPLREIERRVLPSVPGGQYIGFDFDSGSGIYTLKFLRNGNVIWVDVDGRSGQIIGRAGN